MYAASDQYCYMACASDAKYILQILLHIFKNLEGLSLIVCGFDIETPNRELAQLLQIGLWRSQVKRKRSNFVKISLRLHSIDTPSEMSNIAKLSSHNA